MERIASLIEQLQQAVSEKADTSRLVLLANMLQAELQLLHQKEPATIGTPKVAVVMPGLRTVQQSATVQSSTSPLPPKTETKKEEEKILEVLQVNEAEVEAELEEIRQKAEFAKKIEAKAHTAPAKPALLFDDEPEIPTLIHQPNYKEPAKKGGKEINETVATDAPSLNDLLKQATTEVAHKLSEAGAIKDLKKAIGINDRFVFINELFRGDEAMYERSIKTINNFSIYPEAQYWMERELKIKLGWDDHRQATQDFYALVKRRFS
ncbi:MAG TPA: hypothetical protein VFV46_01585 [Lacibacter sp.]|nr:hypothetical protein [Lacibacter sp.]